MLDKDTVRSKLVKLMDLLNTPHVNLNSFADHLWFEYKELDMYVFLNACKLLSEQSFIRFPQMSDFRKAIGKAYQNNQDKFKREEVSEVVSEDDRPTREDWKAFMNKMGRVMEGTSIPGAKNVEETQKEKDRNEVRAAIKRRKEPGFKFKEHKEYVS